MFAPPPPPRPHAKPPLSPLGADAKAAQAQVVRSASSDAHPGARKIRAEWVPDVNERMKIGWVPEAEVMRRIQNLEKQLRKKDHTFWESAQRQDAALEERSVECGELREEVLAMKGLINEEEINARTCAGEARAMRKEQRVLAEEHSEGMSQSQARLSELESKFNHAENRLSRARMESSALQQEMMEEVAQHAEQVSSMQANETEAKKSMRDDRNKLESRLHDEEDACGRLEHDARCWQADCEEIEDQLQGERIRLTECDMRLRESEEQRSELEVNVSSLSTQQVAVRDECGELQEQLDDESGRAVEMQTRLLAIEEQRAKLEDVVKSFCTEHGALKTELSEEEARATAAMDTAAAALRDHEQEAKAEMQDFASSQLTKAEASSNEVRELKMLNEELSSKMEAVSAQLIQESRAADKFSTELAGARSEEVQSATQISTQLSVTQEQHEAALASCKAAKSKLVAASLEEAALEEAATSASRATQQENNACASRLKSSEEEVCLLAQKVAKAESLTARCLVEERAERSKCQEHIELERSRLAPSLGQAVQAARMAAERADEAQQSEKLSLERLAAAEHGAAAAEAASTAARAEVVDVLAGRAEALQESAQLAAARKVLESELAEARSSQVALQNERLSLISAAQEHAAEMNAGREGIALGGVAEQRLEAVFGEEQSKVDKSDAEMQRWVAEQARLRVLSGAEMQMQASQTFQLTSSTLRAGSHGDEAHFNLTELGSTDLRVTVKCVKDLSSIVDGKPKLVCSCELRGREFVAFRTDSSEEGEPIWNEEHVVEGCRWGDCLDFKVSDVNDTSIATHIGSAVLDCREFFERGFDGEINLVGNGGRSATLQLRVEPLQQRSTQLFSGLHAQHAQNADWQAELDEAKALAAELREQLNAANARHVNVESNLSTENACLMETRRLAAKQSEELSTEMAALATLKHTISDQCQAFVNAFSGDGSDSSDDNG